MSLHNFVPAALRSKPFIVAAGLVTVVSVGAASYYRFEPGRAEARHREEGDRYLRENHPAEAVIEYRAALQNRPNSAETYSKLAEAYRLAGDFARAGDSFRHAADLSADDVQTLLRAGWYSLVQQRPADAKRFAERVLAADPNNASAQRLLANALAALGDIDGGLNALKRSADLEPLRSTTYSNIGLLESARGRNDAANAAFARARELESGGSSGGSGGGAMFLGGARRQDNPTDPGKLPQTIIDEGPGLGLTNDGHSPVVTGTIAKNEEGDGGGGKGGTTIRFETIDRTTGQSIEGLGGGRLAAEQTPAASPVPEPSSVLLLVSGGLIGAGARWLKQRRTRRAAASAEQL